MVFLIFSIETKNESNVSILHNKFVISVHKFKYSVVLKHLKKSWCILFQKPDVFFVFFLNLLYLVALAKQEPPITFSEKWAIITPEK